MTDITAPPAGADSWPELERYGIEWQGPNLPIALPMPDGYWTPWHVAEAGIKSLARNLDYEQTRVSRLVHILTGIHQLLAPKPFTATDGSVHVFRNPDGVHDQLQALSDSIRAIPEKLALIGAQPEATPADTSPPGDCISRCGSGEPCDTSRCPLPDTDEHDDLLPAVDRLTMTAPERIWLQVSEDEADQAEPYPGTHNEVTWCRHSVGGAEVAYVRRDLAGRTEETPREYRLLTERDVIKPDDEFLRDDCVTWEQLSVSNSFGIGSIYRRGFFVPMRRAVEPGYTTGASP